MCPEQTIPKWCAIGLVAQARHCDPARIKPGHPQQNGRHERMHLTLKKEATRPARFNSLQQQDRFDAFVHEFNAERPHEALDMNAPPNATLPHCASMTACQN
jgi:transposase InsO family protein